MLRYVCRFHPQAWVNDYAIAADAEGDATFDVTRDMRAIAKNERLAALDGAVADLDWLRETDGAPAWVRDWSGPFECTVAIGRLPLVRCVSTMPRPVVNLSLAWEHFTVAVAKARADAARLTRIEAAGETHISAFDWDGARGDEGKRAALRVARRIAGIAEAHFAPPGQRLSIDADPLTADLRAHEESLRRTHRDGDRDRDWNEVANEIDAAWMTFSPRGAWNALSGVYGRRSREIATEQAVGAFLGHFQRRNEPLFERGKAGCGVLRIDVYNDGELGFGERERLYQAVDTLGRVADLAVPEAQGRLGHMAGVLARALGDRRSLISRERFDLGPVGHAVTFKTRVVIHVAAKVAEAISLLVSTEAVPQAA